jgi:hypothetical protein
MLDRTSLEHTLRALHERRIDIEERLRSAEQRRRFHPHPKVQEAAAREESAVLVDLDRIMTRIRAAEAKLALVKQGRQPPVG